MKQVEQMLRELEQNAQRKIAIINGVVILEEDRPKYEAILKLKAFVEDNQNIFRELNTLAGAAGVEVNSLVNGYAPEKVAEETNDIANEEAKQEQVVPKAEDNDYTLEPPISAEIMDPGYLPKEVPMDGQKGLVSDAVAQMSDSFENVSDADSPDSSLDEDKEKSGEDLDVSRSLVLRDYLKEDNIEISLKYPENQVDVYHALNTWVANNVIVPMGYICYARVNEIGNADVFLGKLEDFSWSLQDDQKLYETVRKDLVLYYDATIVEDISSFEHKHNITRVDQLSLPINILKKKLYDTISYVGENPNVGSPDIEKHIVDVPPVDVPVQEPSISKGQDDVSLSYLLPYSTLTIDAKIPDNKYSVHDGLRKWLSENVILPDGYVLYVTVTNANEATIYLGKKSTDDPLALHELKTVDVEAWENMNGISRVEAKSYPLVVNSAIRDDVSSLDATTNNILSGTADYAVDGPKQEPNAEGETKKVVGRRLTEWTSIFSKNQTIRKGINFLNKLTGKSPLYINYMDSISTLDLNDPDIFDKLGVIVNNFERDKALFVSEAEKEKIKSRLDHVVSLAQENISKGR